MQRNNICASDKTIQISFKTDPQFFFDTGRKAVAFIINDIEPECPGPYRDCFTDATKANDTKRLASNPVTEHAGWAPALPCSAAHHAMTLSQAAGDVKDQCQCQVRSIIREYAGRVGDHDTLRLGCRQIYMVHTRAITCDQF